MSIEKQITEVPESPHRTKSAPDLGEGSRRRFQFSRISGLFALLAVCVIFSLWIPDLFLTTSNLSNILGSQAVTAIITLGLLFPLAAGAFDLSIGFIVATSGMLAAYLVVEGTNPFAAAAAGVLVGGLFGALNGFLVVVLKFDSFIATLGTGSIFQAVLVSLTGNQVIIGLPEAFNSLGRGHLLGIPKPFIYLVVLALVFWYLLQHTPFGRQLYAIGGSHEAARLAGVRTGLYLFIAFVISGLTSAFAGVVVTASLAAGTPDLAGAYLLPSYAAAILGATQIYKGRYNVGGALIANYLLATGVMGLQLAGSQIWVSYLFNGIALLLALGFSQHETVARVRRAFMRRK